KRPAAEASGSSESRDVQTDRYTKRERCAFGHTHMPEHNTRPTRGEVARDGARLCGSSCNRFIGSRWGLGLRVVMDATRNVRRGPARPGAKPAGSLRSKWRP